MFGNFGKFFAVDSPTESNFFRKKNLKRNIFLLFRRLNKGSIKRLSHAQLFYIFISSGFRANHVFYTCKLFYWIVFRLNLLQVFEWWDLPSSFVIILSIKLSRRLTKKIQMILPQVSYSERVMCLVYFKCLGAGHSNRWLKNTTNVNAANVYFLQKLERSRMFTIPCKTWKVQTLLTS